MAGVLEVWIAQPSNLCAVDDEKWTVDVHNTKLEPLVWENRQFVGMPANNGHWSAPVPPGHYVVSARRRDDDRSKLRTHPALVQVSCEGIACVHLFAEAGAGCEEPGEEKPAEEKPAEETKPKRRPRATGSA